MITFKFDDVKFNVEFSGIVSKAKDPQEILMGAGRGVRKVLQRHFENRDRNSSNPLSERRTHFWDQVKRSVHLPELENYNTVSVSISHVAFAQKVFGGRITAKNAKFLAIPVEERAYGRMPGKGKPTAPGVEGVSSFEVETGLKLFLVKIGGTKSNALEKAVLAVADPANPGHITVEYILTKSVTQTADTEALPPKSLLENAAITQAQKVLARQLAGENPEATA